jgi:hypothetical protein
MRLSMKPPHGPHALYYPFHLCHPETVHRLLARFATIHFRDFMALQLTPMTGVTAFHDRMGTDFPDLVTNGRLVQGYDVSGPLSKDLVTAVDRDLADTAWRHLFHQALCHDRRFQRGLFDLTHSMQIGKATVPGAAALLNLMDAAFQQHPFCVEDIRALSAAPLTVKQGYQFEYGLALIKTSAALVYTDRLAHRHHLQAATDSPAHFALFEHFARRDNRKRANHLLVRQGY